MRTPARVANGLIAHVPSVRTVGMRGCMLKPHADVEDDIKQINALGGLHLTMLHS